MIESQSKNTKEPQPQPQGTVREHLHKYDFTNWFTSNVRLRLSQINPLFNSNFDVELLNLFVENLLIEKSTKNHMIYVPDLMRRIIEAELQKT